MFYGILAIITIPLQTELFHRFLDSQIVACILDGLCDEICQPFDKGGIWFLCFFFLKSGSSIPLFLVWTSHIDRPEWRNCIVVKTKTAGTSPTAMFSENHWICHHIHVNYRRVVSLCDATAVMDKIYPHSTSEFLVACPNYSPSLTIHHHCGGLTPGKQKLGHLRCLGTLEQ